MLRWQNDNARDCKSLNVSLILTRSSKCKSPCQHINAGNVSVSFKGRLSIVSAFTLISAQVAGINIGHGLITIFLSGARSSTGKSLGFLNAQAGHHFRIIMETFSTMVWVYCDKATGAPITSHKQHIHTMAEKPSPMQCYHYSLSHCCEVVPRQATISLIPERRRRY